MGGKQVITFLDGYATSLQCRLGLMFMNFLGKPTDADMAKYPTVILTEPHPLCVGLHSSYCIWRSCLGPDAMA